MSPASLAGSAGPSTSCASSIMSADRVAGPHGGRTSVAAARRPRGPRRAARSAAARNSATPRSATARTSVATRLAAVRTSDPTGAGPPGLRGRRSSGSGRCRLGLAPARQRASVGLRPGRRDLPSSGRRDVRRRPAAAPARRHGRRRGPRAAARSPAGGAPPSRVRDPVDRRARHDRPGLRQAVALDDAVPGRLLERRRPRPRQRHPAARAQPQAGQRGAQALRAGGRAARDRSTARRRVR
jgi:hypothetical protein